MARLIVAFIFCLTFVFTVVAQSARLEGQVVCCAECWGEADRTKWSTEPLRTC